MTLSSVSATYSDWPNHASCGSDLGYHARARARLRRLQQFAESRCRIDRLPPFGRIVQKFKSGFHGFWRTLRSSIRGEGRHAVPLTRGQGAPLPAWRYSRYCSGDVVRAVHDDAFGQDELFLLRAMRALTV